NPETQELTFNINSNKVFEQSISLLLAADIAGVAEFQVGSTAPPDPQLVLTSTVTASLVLTVNLAACAGAPFLVEQAEFDITVSADANDIDGSARIGAFGIDLKDGSVAVNFTVGVSAENLTDLDDLTLTPTLSGTASANLPVHLAAD